MTLTYNIFYNTTPYFDAGMKEITIEWKENHLPILHSQIDIVSVLGDQISPKECFELKEGTSNIFEYVENNNGWRITDIRMEYNKGRAIWIIIVSEGV